MMHTDTQPARDQAPTTVLLARRLDAPPERVFAAWLDPEMVRKWLLAPSKDDEIVSVEIDPQVGGRFSFVVRRGGEEIDHLGAYVEIDPPRRLAFTWDAVVASLAREGRAKGGATLVTIDLAPAGAGTELRLIHEGIPEEYAARTEQGWSKIIQALANALAP